MDLTICDAHAKAGVISDLSEAIEVARSIIVYGMTHGHADVVAGVLSSERRYNMEYRCCPAASYATYLACAAARIILAGEGGATLILVAPPLLDGLNSATVLDYPGDR